MVLLLLDISESFYKNLERVQLTSIKIAIGDFRTNPVEAPYAMPQLTHSDSFLKYKVLNTPEKSLHYLILPIKKYSTR